MQGGPIPGAAPRLPHHQGHRVEMTTEEAWIPMRAPYFPPSAAVAAAIAACAGCYHPSPQAGAPCSETGECPSGLACIDSTCVDPTTLPADAGIDACPGASCMGDQLMGCGEPVTCSLGCIAQLPAHCA